MIRIKLPWFQPNPGKTTWHLEHRGRIVAKGRSMAAMVRRIKKHVATPKPKPKGCMTIATSVWIEITGKPTETAKCALKALGFFWHWREKIWCAPFTDERLAQAQKILN